MACARRYPRADGAFAYVEVLLAVTILAVGLAGILTGFHVALAGLAAVRAQQDYNLRAREALADMERLAREEGVRPSGWPAAAHQEGPVAWRVELERMQTLPARTLCRFELRIGPEPDDLRQRYVTWIVARDATP